MGHHCTFQCPVLRLVNILKDEELTRVSRFSMKIYRKKCVLRSLLEFWQLSPYAYRKYREGDWPQHDSNQQLAPHITVEWVTLLIGVRNVALLKSRFDDELSSDFFVLFLSFTLRRHGKSA